jgi:phosphate transport system protein
MNKHIVKAYDEDLQALNDFIRRMGELSVQQIASATQAVVERDNALAEKVIASDYKINRMETKVDALAMRILALRQPVASDLRMVVAALKISSQVERIADYACNIAKRALLLNKMDPSPLATELSTLVKNPQRMIERVLAAFTTSDVNLALDVWQMDQEVDDLYDTFLSQLFDAMIADSKNISPCTHLLFIAKNIERIGDQSTNIAEAVYTMVTGKPFKESEPLKHVSASTI